MKTLEEVHHGGKMSVGWTKGCGISKINGFHLNLERRLEMVWRLVFGTIIGVMGDSEFSQHFSVT